jgi:hypothetical protein
MAEPRTFLGAVAAAGSGMGWGGGRSGSAPSPFDAVDRRRLGGPDGSHPLASVSIEELVAPRSDAFDGGIEVRGPVRVGEGIAGRVSVVARRDIRARGAVLRLVGARIAEESRSVDHRDHEGKVTRTERWVEVAGRLFEELPFPSPVLPATMAAGERFETEFELPAPRLGPPTGHVGTGILAWALDARWDIAMGSDARVTTLVEVRQHPDYLRSGAARLAAGSLHDAWGVGAAGGAIRVSPVPPLTAGSEAAVIVEWPGAPDGRGARLELQADIEGPNGITGLVLWSSSVEARAFREGMTTRVPLPVDAPPTVSAHGVGVAYRLRALVDRAFRPDVAIERPIAVL